MRTNQLLSHMPADIVEPKAPPTADAVLDNAVTCAIARDSELVTSSKKCRESLAGKLTILTDRRLHRCLDGIDKALTESKDTLPHEQRRNPMRSVSVCERQSHPENIDAKPCRDNPFGPSEKL